MKSYQIPIAEFRRLLGAVKTMQEGEIRNGIEILSKSSRFLILHDRRIRTSYLINLYTASCTIYPS